MISATTVLQHLVQSSHTLFITALVVFEAIAGDACAGEPAAASTRAATKPFLGLEVTEPNDLPMRLSETGAFSDCVQLVPNASLLAYEINHAFWSDGAFKRRWFAVPAEPSTTRPRTVGFTSQGIAKFPHGSVFVKHFEKSGRRLETRLLFCLNDARVFGGSYRWRADQREAELVTAAAIGEFADDSSAEPWEWYFPSPDDCTKCHTQLAGGVLGLSTAQLNRPLVTCDGQTVRQLDHWQQLGLIDLQHPANELREAKTFAAASEAGASVELRLRAYLHVNCGYCHQPGGAAADFDVRFQNTRALSDLIGRPARINFGIDRARLVAPNDPWRSLMLVRMKTLQATKMPPLGHQSLDSEGIELLEQWIDSLPGADVLAPPVIEPSGQNFSAAMRVRISHRDPQATIRYTLDGLPPTLASPIYNQPLKLDASATVRARAFREDWTRSITVNNTYIRD